MINFKTSFKSKAYCDAEIELAVCDFNVYKHFSPPFLQLSSVFHLKIKKNTLIVNRI
jgi:hypothetical protein